MRSILLCEGPDDLWFAAYYLHKVAGWDDCIDPKASWPYYTVSPLNKRQKVECYDKGSDSIAIWSVGGKDRFNSAITTILEKFVGDYPEDPVNSVVVLRDKDTDDESQILLQLSKQFKGKVQLQNKTTSVYSDNIDGIDVNINITPVIIPFDDCGAIESVLMEAVRESGAEASIIVEEACKYINGLLEHHEVGHQYLRHEREGVKAKFAATIAATSPGHSTGQFQELVMSCPWETSACVKQHFDVIVDAVTSK